MRWLCGLVGHRYRGWPAAAFRVVAGELRLAGPLHVGIVCTRCSHVAYIGQG